jgi:hypothetical protein
VQRKKNGGSGKESTNRGGRDEAREGEALAKEADGSGGAEGGEGKPAGLAALDEHRVTPTGQLKVRSKEYHTI